MESYLAPAGNDIEVKGSARGLGWGLGGGGKYLVAQVSDFCQLHLDSKAICREVGLLKLSPQIDKGET